MVEPREKLCVVCAWRETCQKRFSFSREMSLHCKDFTRDVTLKDKPESPSSPQERKPPDSRNKGNR